MDGIVRPRAARSVTLLSGVMADTLDSQAAAFAQLLKMSGDPDAAVRSAVALADDMRLGKTRRARGWWTRRESNP